IDAAAYRARRHRLGQRTIDQVAQVTEDSPSATEPLLKVRGLEKHFGPVQALYAVDLDLPAGQVTALAGDNGAGKSVLTKCISGVYQADHGQIFWESQPVHIRNTRGASHLVVETVYQELALCANLDLIQNMSPAREVLRRRLLGVA